MPISADLLQAKQTLSPRLLRAGLQGNAVGRSLTLRVHDAVAFAGQNVHAVGVGRKVVNGVETETFAVRIYVVQKIAQSLLPPRNRLPETIDGLPTDIIESPPASFMARRRGQALAAAPPVCTENRQKRQRPIIAGISAAHGDVTAGTISCFCRSTLHGDDPSKVYVLSNNHAFANVDLAQVGDDLFQPAPTDGGMSGDHFAQLHRFVGIKLGGQTPNRVDAAIGELLPGQEFKNEICQLGEIKGVEAAVENLAVCMHGRTTGFTEGKVTDESLDGLVIGVDHSNSNVVALFDKQMRIDRVSPHLSFGRLGDSGALVLSQSSKKAVGLYFAGPPSGEYGLANQFVDVQSELQIELL